MCYMDSKLFLPGLNLLYTDKASMAASVEVRVPFMDLELLRLAARIPERFKCNSFHTKYILKRSLSQQLPKSVIARSKTGFGAPLREWLSRDLSEVVDDLLSPSQVEMRGLFDPGAVRQLVRQNKAKEVDHTYLLYALLNLELWQQTFLDRPGEEVVL